MQQLRFDGKTKEEIAIEFLKKHEPDDGYFVCFSGGKDSIVSYDLTKKSGVKHIVGYSAVGIDPPELCKFIRKHYPEVRWYRPLRSWFAEIPRRGYPTRRTRWCCDFLKKDPTKHIKLDRIMGLRAEESRMRAKRSDNPEFHTKYKQWIVKPIFDWLEWEVWEYIERHSLAYPSLYDEGFGRIGCVVCPFLCNLNTWNLDRHKGRWPKHYYAFEKAMKRLWDKRQRDGKHAVTEKTFDEFLHNWYRGISSGEEDYNLFDTNTRPGPASNPSSNSLENRTACGYRKQNLPKLNNRAGTLKGN